MKYKIKNEYINIENYSPFSHINEVSNEYKYNKFKLPIVNINNSIVPIHPDTFSDLNLNKDNILYYIDVYPTSSFRTVYYKEKNIFIKLPITRIITRGIRTLPNKELIRSAKAQEIIKNIKIKHFYVLEEIQVFNQDERFNYIIRKIPNKNITPLFTIIRKKSLTKEALISLKKDIIPLEYDPYPPKTHAYTVEDNTLMPAVTCREAFVDLLEPEKSKDVFKMRILIGEVMLIVELVIIAMLIQII